MKAELRVTDILPSTPSRAEQLEHEFWTERAAGLARRHGAVVLCVRRGRLVFERRGSLADLVVPADLRGAAIYVAAKNPRVTETLRRAFTLAGAAHVEAIVPSRT